MKKRWLLVGVLVLLFSCLLAGCGVKQELHDAVVADLGEAQQELISVKAELGRVQTELKATESELAVKNTELETAESEIASLVAEKNSLIAEKGALQADYNELNDENIAIKQELADIQNVYPLRYFSSYNELMEWLINNDISERPGADSAEDLFAKAVELQEDAMRDGYILSASMCHEEGNVFSVGCKAVINGVIYSWGVETEDPLNYTDYFDMKILSGDY